MKFSFFGNAAAPLSRIMDYAGSVGVGKEKKAGLFVRPLLSMGAVFALFAGFYYWIGKITGLQYPEQLARIHFWSTFLGVNLTFFPMHFLGLAGMPRRIPDYPDAYAGWNGIASLGSYVSVFAAWLFFYVVYVTLTSGNRAPQHSAA